MELFTGKADGAIHEIRSLRTLPAMKDKGS
jgi:hypothetical protein